MLETKITSKNKILNLLPSSIVHNPEEIFHVVLNRIISLKSDTCCILPFIDCQTYIVDPFLFSCQRSCNI